jgi:hypothetical protein
MKSIFFLLLAPLFGFGQTCIVVLPFKDTIFVGADSRSTLYQTDPVTKRQLTKHITICKINNVGPVYYTISGYPDSYINEFIHKTLPKYKSAEDYLPFFDSSMKIFLTGVIETMMTTDPVRLKHFIQGRICTVCFFGVNNNELRSGEYIFSVELPIKGHAKVASTFVNQGPYIQGMSDHLWKNGIPVIPYNPDVLLYIKQSIEYEKSFHKEEIGIPIDLMYITKSGAHWRTKKRCD